jgi:hypothetical protein
MDPVTVRREFFAKHGNCVKLGDWILFEDGAKAEDGGSLYGQLVDPPADRYERQKLIVRYWQLLTKHFEGKHRHLHHEMQLVASTRAREGRNAPDDHELKPLRDLTAEVAACRKQLKIAERRLKNYTPDSVREQEKREAQGEQDRQSDFRRCHEELDRLKI